MSLSSLIISTTVATLTFFHSLTAHPVAYKGGRQLMLGYSDSIQFAELFYTDTPRAAFGLHSMRLDNDNETFELLSLRRNWLVKRWNMQDAQANLYTGLGLGTARTDHSEWRFAGEGFFQVDYETRKHYAALRSHAMYSTDSTHFWNTFTVGLAPYKAEYDQLNTWILIRTEYISEFQEHTEFIPTLRFFKHNIFVEIGITFDGEIRTLFMIHF